MEIIVESAETCDELVAKLGDKQFDFASLHLNEEYLNDQIPELNCTYLHGATSCIGAMTQSGGNQNLCVFALSDPDGAYGTALASVETSMRDAARKATLEALKSAERVGEVPELIWISATPGQEEEVIAGVESVVGSEVPILGGSAADNDVSGKWRIFDSKQIVQSGVIVSVLFPSRPVSFAYQSGYSPSAHTGIVTKVSDRTVYEIDHKPALSVYSAWTDGEVAPSFDDGDQQMILSESTLWPLGRELNRLSDVPFYLLAHPAVAKEDGSIDLFASVAEGEEITLMEGRRQTLIERAGRVASLARKQGGPAMGKPKAALMIYCGGCMLSVQDDIQKVVDGVNDALEGAPFLGAFTFGEQGNLLNGGNRHGNLMISCIVFG